MLTLVFIKSVSDLALYYSFAGLFALLFGGSNRAVLLGMVIQAAIFTFSYLLRQRQRSILRFLPLLLLIFCWLIPGSTLANYILLIPAVIYMIYLVAKKIYEPDCYQQKDIFSIYWKVFIVFALFAALLGARSAVTAIAIPAGLICMACSVLLQQTLRHDPEVYCQPRYQVISIVVIGAVCVCALFLSSSAFLNACLRFLQIIYNRVIAPILMAIVYVIIFIINGIVQLISLFHINISTSSEGLEIDMSGFSARDVLGIEEDVVTDGQILERILIAIAIIAAAVILILLFRALSRRTRSQSPEPERKETRTSIQRNSPSASENATGSVARVRTQYKKFLKLAFQQSVQPDKSDTSAEINRKYRHIFDSHATEELRDLYIEARYNGKATNEDAQRAKKLYSDIKKSASDQD